MIYTTLITEKNQISALARLAHEIWHECFSSIISCEQIDYMLSRFLSEEAILDLIENESYSYYFVSTEKNGAPVGFFAVQPCNGTLFLSKLYLKAEARGKGLGGSMLDYICKLAGQIGAKSVWLTVNRNNETAINVYRKKGFKVIREQVADIGNGFVMDDFVFEKKIL